LSTPHGDPQRAVLLAAEQLPISGVASQDKTQGGDRKNAFR